MKIYSVTRKINFMFAVVLLLLIPSTQCQHNKFIKPDLKQLANCALAIHKDYKKSETIIIHSNNELVDDIAKNLDSDLLVINNRTNDAILDYRYQFNFAIIITDDTNMITKYSLESIIHKSKRKLFIHLGKTDIANATEFLEPLLNALIIDKNGNVYKGFKKYGESNQLYSEYQFNCNEINPVKIRKVLDSEYNNFTSHVLKIQIEYRHYIYIDGKTSMNGVEMMLFKDITKKYIKIGLFMIYGGSSGTFVTLGDYQNYKRVSTINPYLMDYIIIVVPKANKIPRSLNLVYIFDINTWILILLAAIIFPITYTAMNGGDYIINLINQTGTFLGQGLNLPALQSSKLLFTIWVIYSMIITNAFSGLILSFLASPFYYKQIETLDDILELNWPIITHNNELCSFLSKDFNCSYEYFPFAGALQAGNFDHDLERNYPTFWLTTTSESAKYFIENKKQYYTVQLSSKLVGITAVNTYPVPNLFNRYIPRFVENGLITKWIDEFKDLPEIKNLEPEVLRLHDFYIAFYVYLTGVLISFNWEILCRQFQM